MDINKMREVVISAYPNPTWKNKVLCMHDNQIYAVYCSLLERGVFNKKKKSLKKHMKLINYNPNNEYEQMSLFDKKYIKENVL